MSDDVCFEQLPRERYVVNGLGWGATWGVRDRLGWSITSSSMLPLRGSSTFSGWTATTSKTSTTRRICSGSSRTSGTACMSVRRRALSTPVRAAAFGALEAEVDTSQLPETDAARVESALSELPWGRRTTAPQHPDQFRYEFVLDDDRSVVAVARLHRRRQVGGFLLRPPVRQ